MALLEKGIARLSKDGGHRTAHNAAGRRDVGCSWRLALLLILVIFSLFVLSHVPFQVVGFFVFVVVAAADVCVRRPACSLRVRVLLVRLLLTMRAYASFWALPRILPFLLVFCLLLPCLVCFDRDMVSVPTQPFFLCTYLWDPP